MEIIISTSGLLSILGFIVAQTISFVIFCINIWKDLYVLKSEITLNQSQDTKEITELKKITDELNKDIKFTEKGIRKTINYDIKRMYDKLEAIKHNQI